jgi:AcrR family transcriptional regulator
MRVKADKPEIQERVLQKAAQFFAKRGVKGWNTADLARETGLAKNTLYKIIDSKQNLAEKVLIEQIKVTTNLINRIIQEEGDYRLAARRIFDEGPVFLSKRPRVTMTEIFVEYPAIEQKVLEYQTEAASFVVEFIKKGQSEGHIRNDVEPEFLYDLIRGIVEHYTRKGLEQEYLTQVLIQAMGCLRKGVRLGDW